MIPLPLEQAAPPVTLTPLQRERLREAEAERLDTEVEYLRIAGPAFEAYLRMARDAALRSLHGAGVLVAAAEPPEVEEDIDEIIYHAREDINPRSESEPFTAVESAIIWLAVIGALARTRNVPAPLYNALARSTAPDLIRAILVKIQADAESLRLGALEVARQVNETLQLPRPLSQIIGRETAGVLMPPSQSPLGKVFEGRLIEVARNAAGAAVGEARLIELQERGVERKMWASIYLDDRVRPSHMAAHGQVQPVDETFYVGSTRLMFPCDPNGPIEETANCRCVIIEP